MVMCQNAAVTTHFWGDPVQQEVIDLLNRMNAGEVIDRSEETKHVDLKEEAGRRGLQGTVEPGEPRSEQAAKQLADEAACMANTPGGGALIVGVADDGTLIGAVLDGEWLRQRIFQLTQRLLTLDVLEVTVRGVRLLVLRCPPAVEPIRMNNVIKWRVNDSCVQIDAASWHSRRMQELNYDWSGDASPHPISSARPQALAAARDFLKAGGDDSSSEDLARATDEQLLRRLNAVADNGNLTNAGALAFVGRGAPSLDYMRRDYRGGDSTARVCEPGLSLLEELASVFLHLRANNAISHLQTDLVVRQIRDIPELAAREAIVNGVAHRVWGLETPTIVEHIGKTLRVISPGGFYGSVTEANIITHPSQSRNPALTQLLAKLRIAEREGIGVDRMVREMVRVGHRPPVIREIEGPTVTATLVGDALDESWIEWLSKIRPPEESMDVSSLLILDRLLTQGWIDEGVAAPLIQLPVEETRGAIRRLAKATYDGKALLQSVDGTPVGSPSAWRLTASSLDGLLDLDRGRGPVRSTPSRPEVAKSYAESRGRISTTELGSLVGAHATNVGAVLKDLERQQLLQPSSAVRRGRGFFYLWAGGVSLPGEVTDSESG
jgi:ATP-dependent DNA helicase RecG